MAVASDQTDLRTTYHRGAQLVSVLLGPAALMLVLFGDTIMLVWTGDRELAAHVSPILRVMALGTLMHGLMFMPYHLQLAHGWTSLSIHVNLVAVLLLVPAIVWSVPRYGASGAAWVWVVLNAGYVIFTIGLMHRRLLPTEKVRWYRDDVLLPLSAGALMALACRLAMPHDMGRLIDFVVLATSGVLVVAASAWAAPLVRREAAFELTQRYRKAVYAVPAVNRKY